MTTRPTHPKPTATEAGTSERTRVAGWIYFDGECRFCVAGRNRWGRVFERRGFVWVPLQTPGSADRLGITPEQLNAEMWFLPAGGGPQGGVYAWIALMRHVWWLKPVGWVLRLPGILTLAKAGYKKLASNRHCLGGRCRIPRHVPKESRRHSVFLELP